MKVRKATSETRFWGFVFSSRLHIKKKKKKKAELELCMEYKAGVDDALMRKLLVGWISAVKMMVVEEKLMAEICSEASVVEFEKPCKRKTKNGNQVTALWTK